MTRIILLHAHPQVIYSFNCVKFHQYHLGGVELTRNMDRQTDGRTGLYSKSFVCGRYNKDWGCCLTFRTQLTTLIQGAVLSAWAIVSTPGMETECKHILHLPLWLYLGHQTLEPILAGLISRKRTPETRMSYMLEAFRLTNHYNALTLCEKQE